MKSKRKKARERKWKANRIRLQQQWCTDVLMWCNEGRPLQWESPTRRSSGGGRLCIGFAHWRRGEAQWSSPVKQVTVVITVESQWQFHYSQIFFICDAWITRNPLMRAERRGREKARTRVQTPAQGEAKLKWQFSSRQCTSPLVLPCRLCGTGHYHHYH